MIQTVPGLLEGLLASWPPEGQTCFLKMLRVERSGHEDLQKILLSRYMYQNHNFKDSLPQNVKKNKKTHSVILHLKREKYAIRYKYKTPELLSDNPL